MKGQNEIFKSVLHVATNLKVTGGIASVVNMYASRMPYFKHLASNHRYGTIVGAFALIYLLLRLPMYRLFGRRILHVHVASGKSFIRKSIIINWAILFGYKVIYHSHGGGIKDYFEKIGIEKAAKTLKKCAVIVTLSEYWKDYFQTTFNLKTMIVNNPIYVPSSVPEQSYDSRINLLFLGALNREKGLFELVEAFRQNRDKWQGLVCLKIGGRGPIEQKLVEIIEDNGLAGIVTMCGWVAGTQKETLLNETNIVILPSYVEALPICLLEGMAHGKALIATNIGGIPSILHDEVNGYLIEPKDVNAISKAIDKYVETPKLLAEHGLKSRDYVQPYDINSVIEDLAKLYSDI